MRKESGSLHLIVIASLAFVLILAVAAPVLGNCEYYENSSANWFWGYGYVCSYTGSGCQHCIDNNGGRCVSGTPYRCTPFQDY